MIDHIGLKVSNLKLSTTFYREALAALGWTIASQGDGYVGFGPPQASTLWLYQHAGAIGPGTHVAIRVADRAAVQKFHQQGLAAGGRDNGEPGLRVDYSPDYYAAFLVDPDGHNVEAVCFN